MEVSIKSVPFKIRELPRRKVGKTVGVRGNGREYGPLNQLNWAHESEQRLKQQALGLYRSVPSPLHIIL